MKQSQQFSRTYHSVSLIAYFLGLLGTIIVFWIYNSSQPALLQINPYIIIGVILVSIIQKQFKKLLMFDEDLTIEQAQIN